MSFFVVPRILPTATFFGVRHFPAREALVPGTFACFAVCFVMPHRLNLECLRCTRWLIACVCTCKFALFFWVLIIRCFRSSIHLRCPSCSCVSDHCWGLDGVESWLFLDVIAIPPLSLILAGRPLQLAPLTGTASCASLDGTSPLLIDLACVGKE